MNAFNHTRTPQSVHPGTVALGIGHQEGGGDIFKLLFICRKGGLDYLGQLKLDARTDTVQLEMFNANYFSQFAVEKDRVLEILETKVLGLLGRHSIVPGHFRELGKRHLAQSGGSAAAELEEAEPAAPDEWDLAAVYDRLNREYFNGRLKGRVEWGRDSKTTNRRSFKFGSFDAKKNLIRIHPRLKQPFVPLCVLELTVYHEMCHQALPPVKRNGQWLAHHPDFKKKEREFSHYKEAVKWEKAHWAKLLAPSPDPV